MAADSAGAAASKKQIYDRIIGDNEVLGGQVVPTEEAPMQPEAQQGDAEQIPQPSGSFNSLSEGGDALPLPMPPPPGAGNDTQGALSTPPARNTAALSSPSAATNSTSTAPGSDIAPVPGETAAAAANEQAAPPAAPAPATEEIVDEAPAPVIKKPAVKKTKAVAENSDESLGAAPVVLVPPADPADGGQIASAPPVVAPPPVPPSRPPPSKRKRPCLACSREPMMMFPQPQVPPAAPDQQVASLPEAAPIQQPAAPTQAASGGSGYFVQLASFKSQAEASRRIRPAESQTLGHHWNPSIGDQSRHRWRQHPFRLAVGPMASRDEATRICSSLVAAGERDCLVRKQ